MIYRCTAYALIILMMPGAAVAETLSGSDRKGDSQQAAPDLTGYWQQDDGQVFHFSQSGTNLTSRRSGLSADFVEIPVDFTATIYGNLIYGAYRAPVSGERLARCASQIWVGMGLTLNEDRTKLTGFRGVRVVDPKSCNVRDSAPVGLVFTRIADPPPIN